MKKSRSDAIKQIRTEFCEEVTRLGHCSLGREIG